MNKERSLPLILLEKIETHIRQNSSIIKVVESDDNILLFKDMSVNSEFYFSIDRITNVANKEGISYSLKPKNIAEATAFSSSTNIELLPGIFQKWIALIKAYTKYDYLLEDPIEYAYAMEFTEATLMDENNSNSYFSIAEQLALDSYFEFVLPILENEINNGKKGLVAIKNAITELKDNQTSMTKKVVVQKLSIIWAKARKEGLSILKQIFISYKDKGINWLINGGFEKLLDTGRSLLESNTN